MENNKFFLIYYNENSWKQGFVDLFNHIIKNLKGKSLSVVLTGGKTACSLYKYWSRKFSYHKKKYTFYLSDERLYEKYKDTNSHNIRNNFINHLNFAKVKYHNINTFPEDPRKECKDYKNKIKNLDVVLLTLAEDGHIASLFKKSKKNTTNGFNFVKIDNRFPNRISISESMIINAKNIIVLVIGFSRGRQLRKSLNNKKSILSGILKKNTVYFLIDYSAHKGYLDFS